MPRVLIVDDEPTIVMVVRDELVFEGMEVQAAVDGPSGLLMAREWRPDVLLLDLMLPGINGFDICRSIRRELPETWIIVVTARGLEVDRITGFEAGADDYVVKPFSLREVISRIRVGLRRRTDRTHLQTYRFGDLVIDLPARRVTSAGTSIQLTRKEFEILILLAKRRCEVVARNEICDAIWGPEVFVTPRVIDSHIAALRRKIGSEAVEQGHIKSVRGVGYMLE